jgi:four helix bundle protein
MNKNIKPHKRMNIWGKSIDFVTLLYNELQKFPDDEKFGLTMQLKRAAVSIPSNIAEGASRKGRKEYLHFLYIARGSVSEIDAQLEIARKLKFLDSKGFGKLQNSIDEISKMLNGLINSVSKTANS